MRRKKHKHTRRTLRFYKIQHGFRPPFKVLLDGNFVHALEAMKKGDAGELVGRLLGEPVKCYTTPCVQQELKKLGKEFAGARHLLKRYPLHKCGHEERVSAADCLLAQLGDKNEEHFFVASQDRALQRRCMAVGGGAVLFASVNGVHLETPSDLQRQRAKQEEQRHLLPSAAELQTAVLAEVAAARQPRAQPGFRHRKAKGPNPLSALPKKKRSKGEGAGAAGAAAAPAPAQADGGAQQQQQQQQQQQAKRKRQRRRGRGGEGNAGGGGGSSD